MKFHVLWKSSRRIAIELEEPAIYETEPYRICVNGEIRGESCKMIHTITDLQPETQYNIVLKRKERCSEPISVITDSELLTLDVKRFGAFGDGIHNDTSAIQAAILSCPSGGRVYIPAGEYPVTALFLKSHMILEVAKGASLLGIYDRELTPILPGEIAYEKTGDTYNLGTWEGIADECFASMITGINVEDVVICGEGTLDGRASFDNWWGKCKEKDRAWRPRMMFLNRCNNVVVQGITVQNSPAWNLHPYFCEDIRFLDMKVIGPGYSPNTDGCNPESCKHVEIAGVYFSVGDDCIAVKSGKIDMGRKYKTPSEDIRIRQSLMRDGHGAVTLGSEIGAGVKNLVVENCRFIGTDRGLRVKTRRGRGEDCVLTDITFRNLEMDGVKAPFVVNSYYFCDPDGHSEYVQSRKALPVDERTPRLDSMVLTFQDIVCRNTHFCGAYIYGLPEQKIAEIVFDNVDISYAENASRGVAAMMDGCEPGCRQGLIVGNVKKVVLNHVKIDSSEGEDVITDQVDEVIRL